MHDTGPAPVWHASYRTRHTGMCHSGMRHSGTEPLCRPYNSSNRALVDCLHRNSCIGIAQTCKCMVSESYTPLGGSPYDPAAQHNYIVLFHTFFGNKFKNYISLRSDQVEIMSILKMSSKSADKCRIRNWASSKTRGNCPHLCWSPIPWVKPPTYWRRRINDVC